jgi:hypothetical protein
MKRKAEYMLDREDLDRDDDEPQPARTLGIGNIATPEQMAQRRIVKLKLPSDILASRQGASDKPAAKFELAGSLGQSNRDNINSGQMEQNTSTPSFLNKIITPSQSDQNQQMTGLFKQNGANNQTNTAGIPITNQEDNKPRSGLFSTLLQKSAKEDLGIRVQDEEKQEEKKPVLFSNLAPQEKTTNTLSGPNVQKYEPLMKVGDEKRSTNPTLFGSGGAGLLGQTDHSKPQPLFPGSGGGLITQNVTSGLFSGLFGTQSNLSNLANKDYSYVHNESGEKKEGTPEQPKVEKKEEKPKEAAKPSLFSALGDFKPSSNLFAQTTSTSGAPNLFSNYSTGKPPSFMGSIQNQGGLLFRSNTGGAEGSEGEEEGDDEPQRSPSPEADITKSKGNYKYEYDYDKIISKKVSKFKPGTKPLLLEGEVSLNKTKEGNIYFIVYRSKAKLIQYQGQVIPKATKIEYLNPRQDAISIIAYSTEKAEETPKAAEDKEGEGKEEDKKETPKENKTKLSKDFLKLMFGTSDECNEFKKELEKTLN